LKAVVDGDGEFEEKAVLEDEPDELELDLTLGR